MPTYDYQCRVCGSVTEVIHSMLESGPESCERCGGELRRVLYPAGIIFKGSGFYRTDSRAAGSGSDTRPSKPGGEPAKADAPASSDGAATSAKPDAPSGAAKPAADAGS